MKAANGFGVAGVYAADASARLERTTSSMSSGIMLRNRETRATYWIPFTPM